MNRKLRSMSRVYVLLVGDLYRERVLGGPDVVEWRIGCEIMSRAARVNEYGRGGA